MKSNIFLVFVVSKRLPRVVLEDSVLYVSRTTVRLASMLLRSFPLHDGLVDLQELDLLPEKIARTHPFVFEKPRICFMFELPNLHLQVVTMSFIVSCQCTDEVLPPSY